MSRKPEILRVATVARSRLFEIEQLDLRFSNGVTACYERLVGSLAGAVLIVPMLDADTVLLVREYAAGLHRYELGLPKGRVERGEEIPAAADRELREEVGYTAGRLTHLRTLSVAPGYLGYTTHVILAEDLRESRLAGDEPEPIEVVPWRLSRMAELLARADLTEARSIAALFLTREHKSHE